MKCIVHVEQAVEERVKELQANGWTRAQVDSVAGSIELMRVGQSAPSADVVHGGRSLCMPCLLEGRI